MINKYYNLTEQPNKGIKDEAPAWMDSLFEKKENKKVSANPFAGINDPILNPQKTGVTKQNRLCSECGKMLSANEVELCNNCI